MVRGRHPSRAVYQPWIKARLTWCNAPCLDLMLQISLPRPPHQTLQKHPQSKPRFVADRGRCHQVRQLVANNSLVNLVLRTGLVLILVLRTGLVLILRHCPQACRAWTRTWPWSGSRTLTSATASSGATGTTTAATTTAATAAATTSGSQRDPCEHCQYCHKHQPSDALNFHGTPPSVRKTRRVSGAIHGPALN